MQLRMGGMNAALALLHDRVLKSIWLACDAAQQEEERQGGREGNGRTWRP